MNTIVSEFKEYVNKQIGDLEEKQKRLKSEDKKDEADLIKVRINIFNIFLSIVDVAYNKAVSSKIKDEKLENTLFCKESLEKFDKIPANWMIRLEQAKENKDIEIVVIEEIKLETAAKLKQKFIQISGGNTDD